MVQFASKFIINTSDIAIAGCYKKGWNLFRADIVTTVDVGIFQCERFTENRKGLFTANAKAKKIKEKISNIKEKFPFRSV